MRGNLERFPLSDVLQIIAELGKSGKLAISRPEEEAAIIFQGGRVIGAASSAVRETLGSLLIGQGLISAEQLEAGLEAQRGATEDCRLGNVLVDLDFLSAEDIDRVVTLQTRQVVQDLLRWRHGLYEFVPLDVEDRGEVQSEVSDLLLSEGLSAEGILVGDSGNAAEGADDVGIDEVLEGSVEVTSREEWLGDSGWIAEDRWVGEDEWPGTVPVVEPANPTTAPDAWAESADEASDALADRASSVVGAVGPEGSDSAPAEPDVSQPEVEDAAAAVPAATSHDATEPIGEMFEVDVDLPDHQSGSEATFLAFPEVSEPTEPLTEMEPSLPGGSEGPERHEERAVAEVPEEKGETGDDLASLRDLMFELRGFELTGELMNRVMAYATERFERAVLFSVQGEHFRSISSFGSSVPVWAAKPIDELRLAASEASVLTDILASRRAHKGALTDTEGNRRLVEFLGGDAPDEAVAAPIIAEQRVVLILYGDNAPDNEPIGSITTLEMLLVQIGLKMERNLLERIGASGTPRPAKTGPELPAEDLRSLLDGDPEPTLVVDSDGRIVYANLAMGSIVGSSTIELVGSDVFQLVHQDDESKLVGILRGIDRGPDSVGGSVRLRRTDGGFRDFYVALSSATDPSASQVAMLRATAGSGLRAAHDPLTGRLSRDGFAEQVMRASAEARQRRDGLYAVLLVDIDRFDLINRGLGWSAGNELLCAVGDRLVEHLRPGDAVARIGANRLAVLLDRVREERDVDMVTERLVRVLSEPYLISEQEVFIAVSVGGASCRGYEDDVDEVMGIAEAAMREAKKAAGSSVRIVPFESGGRSRASERLRLERDLRRAVEDEELTPYYQPIVSLESGRIEAFELLARWTHPQRGLLEPAEFISAAEQTGLIVPMAKLLLREGSDQLLRWQAQLDPDPPLVLTMNFTAAHLEGSELTRTVRWLLDRGAFAGRQLVLEITEGMMIRQREKMLRILAALEELGVRVSLDDFGLEYSSLSYLHRLPVGSIKLDRSFIRDLANDSGAETIMRGIVHLAHSLGRLVVAEGIETPDELAKVKAIGCDLGQGFLLAPPRDAHGVNDWLDGEPPWRDLFRGSGSGGSEASFSRVS